MTAEVAPFDAEHLEDAAAVFLEAFTSTPWNERWTFAQARGRLLDLYLREGDVGYVVTDPLVVGFALGGYVLSASGDGIALLVEEMAVRTSRQCQGHGTRLLRALEERAVADGIHRVEILTSLGKWPCHWYERMGYTVCARLDEVQVVLARAV